MDELKDPNKKESTDDIWRDPDLSELLFASEENRHNETIEPTEAEPESEDIIETPSIQDPEIAHELYYGTLQPLLKKRLERVSKQARSSIRAQVNLLLKDGHKKKRDGKQAYYHRMQQAIEIINRWDRLCNTNQIPLSDSRTFRLFIMFKDEVDKITEKNSSKS